MNKYWRIENRTEVRNDAEVSVADIYIYEQIGESFWGEGVGAKKFAADLDALGDIGQINVRINSPGGSVWDGTAIYNALQRNKANITTYVDGVAASMASVIAMVGDQVIMADNAMMMIHDPWGMVMGNSKDMRDYAEMLDKSKSSLIGAYVNQSGLDADEIGEMMSAETWMTATEAAANGFIDEIGTSNEADARFDPVPFGFVNTPANLIKGKRVEINAPPVTQSILETVIIPAIAAATTDSITLTTTDSTTGVVYTNGGTVHPDSTSGTMPAINPVGQPTPTLEAPPVKPTETGSGAVNPDIEAATAEATATALAADAKRRADIQQLFDLHPGHDILCRTCQDDQTCTAESAGKQLLAELGKGITPLGADPHITGGTDESEKFQAGAENALMYRAQMGERDGANQFNSYSLFEMCRFYAERGGIDTSRLSRTDIVGEVLRKSTASGPSAAGHSTTSDYPNVLANVAHKAMLKGWEEAPETWSLWTRAGNLTDFKIADRAGLSTFSDLDLIPEDGEYKYGRFDDRREQIQLATYGKLFSISRQAIINDDLGVFTTIPRAQGRSASRTVGDVTYAVLTVNANMADGNALFDTATHANDQTTGTVITAVSVAEGRDAMATQTDNNADSSALLSIPPTYMLVPVAIADTAKVLMASEWNPAESITGIPNPVRGLVSVITEARLTADDVNQWYLMANPAIYDTVEVAFLDGVQAPMLERQGGWSVDGVEFKVRIDVAAKALDWRGMWRNAGA